MMQDFDLHDLCLQIINYVLKLCLINVIPYVTLDESYDF